eukprot:305605_1
MSAFTLVISFIVFDFVHIVSCWCQLYLYSNTGLSGTRYGPYDVGCIAFDGTGNFPNDDIDSAQLSSNSAYSCTAVFGASCGCGTGELKQFTTVNPHSTTQIPSFSFGQNVLSCIMLSVNTPQPTTANPTTSNPSYNPSYNPTTEPTTEPTSVPTSNPSFNPTKTTLYPTKIPTKIPTLNPILYNNGQSAENMETTEYIYTTKSSSFIVNVGNNFELEYFVIIIISVLVVFLIVFMIIIYRKKKRIIIKNVMNMDVHSESNTNASVVMTHITNKNDKDIEEMYSKNETLHVTKDENVTDEKKSNDKLYENDGIANNELYENLENSTQCEDNDELYRTQTTTGGKNEDNDELYDTATTTGGKDKETDGITIH